MVAAASWQDWLRSAAEKYHILNIFKQFMVLDAVN